MTYVLLIYRATEIGKTTARVSMSGPRSAGTEKLQDAGVGARRAARRRASRRVARCAHGEPQ